MRTFVGRFWAALAVVSCGAAFALGGDGGQPAHPAPPDPPPSPSPQALITPASLPVPAAAAPAPPSPPSVVVSPAPLNGDAPVEVPGLPPLPPAEAGAPSGEGTEVESTCQPWGGLFVDAEYLYLKPYRCDLNFAILSPDASGVPDGPIVSDPWQSRSAFRVGAGYLLPEAGWQVGFAYTYLHGEQGAFAARSAGGLLFATQTHPGTVEFAATAAADVALSYNVYDLEIGRRLDLGDALTVRRFGGLRFAQIDQNFAVLYNGADANNDTVGSHVRFDGGGLRAGGQADWKVLDHFSLYGRAAGSLMVGDFRVGQTEFNNGGARSLADVSESFRKIVPVLELGAGVAYQRQHLRLSVGYEATNWFGLIDTPGFVDDVHQGKYQRNISDLGVDGLAVKAEFDF